jgi:hypothetical protein
MWITMEAVRSPFDEEWWKAHDEMCLGLPEVAMGQWDIPYPLWSRPEMNGGKSIVNIKFNGKFTIHLWGIFQPSTFAYRRVYIQFDREGIVNPPTWADSPID